MSQTTSKVAMQFDGKRVVVIGGSTAELPPKVAQQGPQGGSANESVSQTGTPRGPAHGTTSNFMAASQIVFFRRMSPRRPTGE
jgi:hypothetical protein